MAADQVTAGLAAMDLNQRLPNFPVPRELRDQIYFYLLHSDYNRIIRKNETTPGGGEKPSCQQGYKFHTNILAVNKAIHTESEEYLYKNNVFVVASAVYPRDSFLPGESLLTASYWTPIVTETHAATMRHHSLRMHVIISDSNGVIMSPIRSCVFLAKELQGMCVNLQSNLTRNQGFGIMIEDDPDASPIRGGYLGWDERKDRLKTPSRLKIQFRDTPFRAGDANMQSKMLDVLRFISAAAVRVTINGVLPELDGHAQRTKDVMGPTLLSWHAIDWRNFVTPTKGKQLTDEVVGVGELHLAETFYYQLMTRALQYFEALPIGPREDLLRNDWAAVGAFDVLRLDLAFSLAYLQLKLGLTHKLKQTMWYLDSVVKTVDLSMLEPSPSTPTALEFMVADVCHLVFLTRLYIQDEHLSPDSVGDAVKILSVYKGFPHQAHDLAILSKVPNQNDLAYKHLPLHMCSASVLPPRQFHFSQLPGVPRKPDNIVGLQNLDSIRRLSHNDKMEINLMEVQHGQKVTKWE